MDTGNIMENQLQDMYDGFEHEQKELLSELNELKQKIKNSDDYFFIYGWQKRVEEIESLLK